MTTSATELQSSNPCQVEGCHSPVFSTGLCGRHKKQQQRQRAAFIKVRPGEEWRDDYFLADVKGRRGRNPKPSLVPLEVAATTHGYSAEGELERLPKKAKAKHLPQEGGDSRVDTWGNASAKANKTRRKGIVAEYKSIHYAEKDRALFLGKKPPRMAHVPTVPATLNPAGWRRSPRPRLVGAFTHVEVVETSMGSDVRMSGYRVSPEGLSKPCKCKSCKQGRKARA
jgi:hypothetical protein